MNAINEKLLITKCCDSPAELYQVGDEYFIKCMSCHRYIGHVTDRRVAQLACYFKTNLAAAAGERNIDLDTITQKDIDSIYEIYLDTLAGWGMQAARQALKEYMDKD